MTVLDIPYISQEDEGADINGKEIYNDCGPTCGAMLIRAYTPEKTFTVNQFYAEMGFKKDQFTSVTSIINVLKKHGISSSWSHSLKLSDLEAFIREKRPPITLINYKTLRQNKIKTYNNSATFHFVVIVGIDGSFVYLNDPLWPGTKGKNFKIPRDIWMKAWGGQSFLNNKGEQLNNQFQALIPTQPLDAEEMQPPEGSIRMKVIFDDYMNVRSGPGTNHRKRKLPIASGAYVTILETRKIGDDLWGRLGEDEWIAISLADDIYLESVVPSVDSQENIKIDEKEEKIEENEMSEKHSVNAGSDSKKDLSVEATLSMDDLSLRAVMDELREIKALLMDMKKNMASGKPEIIDQTEDEYVSDVPISNTPEEPEIPEIPEEPAEPVVNYVEVFTDSKNGQVYLSFENGINRKNQQPIFEFYPGNSSKVPDRVFVKSGEKLKVIPGSKVTGDSGKVAWKLDKNEWIPRMKRSASIPPGIDLMIEEKFISKFIE